LIGAGGVAGFNLAKDWLLIDRRTSLEDRKEREDELRAGRVACLLIADELDTHAMNYRLLADLGRTPQRQVTQTRNFLSSEAWDEHKLDIARLTNVPQETWEGLTHAFHNAIQLRSRVELDGPEVPFPAHRIPTLKDHEAAATELAEILTAAAKRIEEGLKPTRRSRSGWRKFVPFAH
jgi:hypothetical protein